MERSADEDEDMLINSTSTAISDSLLGLATLNPEIDISVLGNVVMQKTLQTVDKVLVLSGGATSANPSYAQFVGSGMLAAAVLGDYLQSPTTGSVLQTIRELTAVSMRGILLVVNGVPGDLLSFGLATERARRDLIKIETVSVYDHYDNCETKPSSFRGLSGIVLILKIAGAMAEQRKKLEEIHDFCQDVSKKIISISFAKKENLNRGKCDCKEKSYLIGSTFGGETPIKQIQTTNLKDTINALVQELFDSKLQQTIGDIRSNPVVLLLNNVGGLTKVEELVVVKELVSCLDQKGVIITRIYSGSFMGSIYFDGLVLTLLKIDDPAVLSYLDHHTSAPGWKNVTETRADIQLATLKPTILRKKPKPATPIVTGPKLHDRHAAAVRTAAKFACEALMSCERQLNKMDSERGNCNTGTNMKTAAAFVVLKFKLGKIRFDLPYHMFLGLSKLCEYRLGGPLGSIFCIIFEAAAVSFQNIDEVDDHIAGPIWLECLKRCVETFRKYTLAKVDDNTLLDPLVACVDATVNSLVETSDYLDAFGRGVSAAEKKVALLKGANVYPDPGSHAIVVILRSIYEGLKNS